MPIVRSSVSSVRASGATHVGDIGSTSVEADVVPVPPRHERGISAATCAIPIALDAMTADALKTRSR